MLWMYTQPFFSSFFSPELPDPPSEVTLHVSSSRSLTVRFCEPPLHNNGAPITRYKSQPLLATVQYTHINTSDEEVESGSECKHISYRLYSEL